MCNLLEVAIAKTAPRPCIPCLEVLLLIVLVPHFAASANGSWHRIVDDDVAGYMEVCDTLSLTSGTCFLALHALGMRSSCEAPIPRCYAPL